MKKFNIILLSIISIMLFATCGKSWLEDVQPQGQLLENNYYQTEDEAYAGLIATYSMWRTKYFRAWSSWYIQSAIPSDDDACMGGGRSDRPEYWQMDDYKVVPENPANQEVWDRCYYGLYRSNIVINRTEPTTAGKKEIIAEAKFLRAWFLFDIIRFWGGGPLFINTLTPSEYNQERKPIADFYTQAVKDLTEAIPDLPDARTGADRYRVTAFGAKAFLGKVYLYMASPYYNSKINLGSATELYGDAAAQFKDVIDNGPYELEANYDTIWATNNEYNKESIVEITFDHTNQNGWTDGSANAGNIDVQLDGVRGAPGSQFVPGWGFDMMTPALVNAYKSEGDSVRLHGSTLAEWQLVAMDPTAVLEKNEGYTGYFCKKRQTWAVDGGNPNWNWGQNERMIRLADVYLMYAEALLGSGQGGADEWLNKVRERAGLADKTATLDAIKLERRLELAGEGHRFFDLVRWGDAATVLGPLGFTADKCEIFPIPQRDIDATSGKLVQNPNY
jgi:starch-binding outer membrane protein, SusD/RagB family